MAKVQFNRTVKYNGKNIPANTIFEVDEKDLKSVLADGGFKIDESPAPLTAKQKKEAEDFEAAKKEAEGLGLTVEETDTILSLQTKIGVKKSEDADAAEKAKALEAKKAEAVTAGVPVEEDDTVDTLQAKIEAKRNAGGAGTGEVVEVDLKKYKNFDKAAFIAELEKRGIDQTALTNNELREAALLADDKAKAEAAGQA